jgi:PadR family transcriptional regulator AphA
MLADGLVTVELIPNESRPSRKIYSITEAGRRALQEWAGQRMQPVGSLKEFVMRLALAGSLPETGLIDYLRQRLEQVSSFRPRIEEALAARREEGDLGQYLTLDYGLALADAERAWLNRALSQLAERSQAVGFPTT